MKLIYSIFFLFFVQIIIVSCKNKIESNTVEKNATINDSIHSISLTRDEPYWLEQPERDVFITNCITCHSSRYIYMQPDFPRKVWQSEVTKMIEKFGAPISKENAAIIVDYLTKIKGKEIVTK